MRVIFLIFDSVCDFFSPDYRSHETVPKSNGEMEVFFWFFFWYFLTVNFQSTQARAVHDTQGIYDLCETLKNVHRLKCDPEYKWIDG